MFLPFKGAPGKIPLHIGRCINVKLHSYYYLLLIIHFFKVIFLLQVSGQSNREFVVFLQIVIIVS